MYQVSTIRIILISLQIYINHTFNITRLVGLEAAKRKVKAFVRMQLPVYETSEKGMHTEKEDVEPSGTVGTWWHEGLRALAAIEEWVLDPSIC